MTQTRPTPVRCLRGVLTGKDEAAGHCVGDGQGPLAASAAQVDAGHKEGEEQRQNPEGEQTLAGVEPVCKGHQHVGLAISYSFLNG